MIRLFQLLFATVFFGLGISASMYSLWSVVHAYQSQSWTSETGQVVSDECRIAGNNVASRHIRYRYAVNSIEYLNDREYFGLRIATNKCVAELQKGQRVSVYYDASNPSVSVLKPGAYRQSVFTLVVGLAFAAFALIVYFRSKRT